MMIFGHRGAAGLAPENTISGMRTALGLGVDGVEFDVRCTRDRIPVLMHDATVDRTTNGAGMLADYSWNQLQQLRVDENETVPSLAAVLEEIGTQTQINVELKDEDAWGPAATVMRSAIDRGVVRFEQLLITSFDGKQLSRFRDCESGIGVGLLTRGLPTPLFWELARRLSASSANIDLDAVNSDFVRHAHQERLHVMVYTVNSLAAAKRLAAWGVDAVFTDYPNVVCRGKL